jgi:hypothetical protein
MQRTVLSIWQLWAYKIEIDRRMIMILDTIKIAERAKLSRNCVIEAAERYESVSDLCILTSYFNPCGYSALLNNYLAFKQSIVQSGLTLITAECAFGDAPFQLPAEENVIQVRSDSVIWQKECLLNVALEAAKDRFTKVAWLDADISFADSLWAVKTSEMLDQFQIVQLFSQVVLLSQGMDYFDGRGHGHMGPSFVSVVNNDPALIKEPYFTHGHTGYGWAARTEALADGFFDGCLLGCGDHVMAHAMFGDIDSACIDITYFNDVASRNYFARWAQRFSSRVNGSVGHCEGTILHHWHGEQKDRNYLKAAQKLARFGVNPETDLRKNADGCWEWNTSRPSLRKYVADYFGTRKEDGEIASESGN